LLMRHGYLKRTCLTTNFDKLMEIAFAQQTVSNFQAIRSDEETRYWGERDKYYVLKLHGDYDTGNILNTINETIRIPKGLQEISTGFLQRSGLVVLGCSGYEQSVQAYLDDLWQMQDRSILNFGIYWGIYMGDRRPAQMKEHEEEKELSQNIKMGSV